MITVPVACVSYFEVGQPFEADKSRKKVRLESLTYAKLGHCQTRSGASLIACPLS
jgi:hypothetical protein